MRRAVTLMMSIGRAFGHGHHLPSRIHFLGHAILGGAIST